MKALYQLGFEIFSTRGTAEYLLRNSVQCKVVTKHFENNQGEMDAVDLIQNEGIDLVINTPFGRDTRKDGWLIRSTAVVKGIPCITTVPALRAAVSGIRALQGNHIKVKSLQDWSSN